MGERDPVARRNERDGDKHDRARTTKEGLAQVHWERAHLHPGFSGIVTSSIPHLPYLPYMSTHPARCM